MQGRIEKNIAMAYNDTTVHSNVPVGRSHACMKICLQNATKGAPLHEQKELRSSGKHRRCGFANGASERLEKEMRQEDKYHEQRID